MSLLSFNIFHGGLDETSNPVTAPESHRCAQIRGFLAARQPHVVILTELNNWSAAHLSSLAKEISHDYCTLMDTTNTQFRIGLTSKFKIVTAEHVRNGFHHGAIVVKLDVSSCGAGFNELVVVGTHLTPYAPSARADEARQLLNLLPRGLPAIIAGDLNSLSPHDLRFYSPEMFTGALAKKFLASTGGIDTSTVETLVAGGLIDLSTATESLDYSVPTCLKVDAMHATKMRLDYAFGTAGLNGCANVLRNNETEFLSDHFPLEIVLN
ncbi:hypothetical protein HDU86_008218 [Geranomyces michiganensis]|nr:hypothetical protein HDU86_008218 [Geranomyces michiganensis]